MLRVLHVLPHRGGGAETYLDILERLDGVAHLRMPLSAGPRPLDLLRFGWRLVPSVWRAARRADVVHAHGDTAALLALPLLARRPSVWTTHGLHLLRRRPQVGAPLARVVRATARTLCTSAAERDELAALPGVPADRLVLLRNAVPVPPPPADRGALRARLGLPPDDVVALFVGELSERKEPLLAVRAARRAGVRLLVAGDGAQRGALEAAAGDGVVVLGQRRDVPDLLDAADVFVLPSVREGLSYAVLEALAHGLPAVVADAPGNAEAVGDAGIVVPGGDEAALADALRALAADPARRAALSAAARRRTERELALAPMLAGVRAAYDAALTEPGRGAAAAPA